MLSGARVGAVRCNTSAGVMETPLETPRTDFPHRAKELSDPDKSRVACFPICPLADCLNEMMRISALNYFFMCNPK